MLDLCDFNADIILSYLFARRIDPAVIITFS